ncbi:hypothetical protein TRFO_02130 [Tritrichomonas foetus]|uniref:Uncharacterized protein n=1 Tax=Tritrichomonas foetus TaxID=1144522 RepID=A0A1J4JD42_9EUKA|nr:hypothetical protein TRFO_02130 [Tritrichomonas foetus]|eukprot:OHS95196.1 hypothetical protein TRFO_02130 [Tritrichomonas foetus]
MSLFNFISYFNIQTNTPIDEQFDILLFFLSRNSNTAQYVINIVYPLLLNPLSNLMNRLAFVQTISSIVSTFIHKIMVEKEIVLFGIEPLLRVCGAFIEVFGNEYIEMVKFAIYILKNGFIPNYYSAILYVIFNAMHANGDFTLSLFDDEVHDILINHSVL